MSGQTLVLSVCCQSREVWSRLSTLEVSCSDLNFILQSAENRVITEVPSINSFVCVKCLHCVVLIYMLLKSVIKCVTCSLFQCLKS